MYKSIVAIALFALVAGAHSDIYGGYGGNSIGILDDVSSAAYAAYGNPVYVNPAPAAVDIGYGASYAGLGAAGIRYGNPLHHPLAIGGQVGGAVTVLGLDLGGGVRAGISPRGAGIQAGIGISAPGLLRGRYHG